MRSGDKHTTHKAKIKYSVVLDKDSVTASIDSSIYIKQNLTSNSEDVIIILPLVYSFHCAAVTVGTCLCRACVYHMKKNNVHQIYLPMHKQKEADT